MKLCNVISEIDYEFIQYFGQFSDLTYLVEELL